MLSYSLFLIYRSQSWTALIRTSGTRITRWRNTDAGLKHLTNSENAEAGLNFFLDFRHLLLIFQLHIGRKTPAAALYRLAGCIPFQKYAVRLCRIFPSLSTVKTCKVYPFYCSIVDMQICRVYPSTPPAVWYLSPGASTSGRFPFTSRSDLTRP
jgi:hypothetical protein